VRAAVPDNEEVWMNLRDALRLTGRHADALADFLAYEKTGKASIWTMIANLASCRSLGDPIREHSAVRAALDWPYQGGQHAIVAEALMLLHYFDVGRDDLFRLYQTYNRLQFRPPAKQAQASRRPGTRWRIGYVSADFRRHVMGPLMAQWLLEHDMERFEIYCYSLAPQQNEDDLTAVFRDLSARFVRLESMSDEDAAGTIAEDDLDLLIDLMGHTTFVRPGIYLHRPSRVMITHLGYHGALGLEEIDFKVSDRVVDLPENEHYLIENLLPLECCVMPFRHIRAAEAPPSTRAELGISEHAVVFATFVSALKMSPRCLNAWRRILEEVPVSYLAFSPYTESDREGILRQLAGYGISPDRVVFIPSGADQREARARYRLVDAVLDTFPYSGGDTTMAALDMGAPVVTLTGLRQSERMSQSILTHLGVTDTIAQSEEEYIAIALRLAREPQWREALSRRIGEGLEASGMADPARYTRALEDACLEALRRKGFRLADQSLPE
jgi:predicted O-linked N-acetylglucosamine transferase (SPINDLY family)